MSRQQVAARAGAVSTAVRPGVTVPRSAGFRPPAGRPTPPLPARPAAVPVRGCRVSSGYRMGRWERLSMTVAATGAVLGVVFGLFDAAPTTERVPVNVGDTVWSIAAELAGDRDVRQVVADIVRLNPAATTALQPGTYLTVPAG